jgi:hypothetical protein
VSFSAVKTISFDSTRIATSPRRGMPGIPPLAGGPREMRPSPRAFSKSRSCTESPSRPEIRLEGGPDGGVQARTRRQRSPRSRRNARASAARGPTELTERLGARRTPSPSSSDPRGAERLLEDALEGDPRIERRE